MRSGEAPACAVNHVAVPCHDLYLEPFYFLLETLCPDQWKFGPTEPVGPSEPRPG